MRTLLLLWDGGGNVPPALSLASSLVLEGHEVYVACHDSLKSQIQGRGLNYLSYDSGYVYDPSLREDFEKTQAAAQQGLIFGSDYYHEATRLLAEVQPEVVLVDGMLSYAVKACLDSPVPTVALWHTLYTFIAGGPHAAFFDPVLAKVNVTGTPTGYATYRDLLEAGNAVLVFTYNGFDDLGNSTADNVLFVGPLRESHEVSSRPSEAPFVVVALSSVFTNQGAVLSELATALGRLEVDALITTGRGVAPDEVVAFPNVKVRQFVPHDSVLPHTDLLITHAGCGTVMAGLKYGAPMLCLPNNGDQPLIASRAKELGLGLTMDQHSPADSFAPIVRSMLVDSELKKTARDVADTVSMHPGIKEALAMVTSVVST